MPAQVCRRWRRLILGSASHLRLCLVCTEGTPVADMLAHSPPLPLIIDYQVDHHKVTAGDEEGIMLALQRRDRVRRISLRLETIRSLQKIITAINDEFLILEFLSIVAPSNHNENFILPSTFEAPQLRILILTHFASLIGSPSLTTAVGLSVLSLQWIRPSIYPHPDHLHPNQLLQTLSLLPHLETLKICFHSPQDFTRHHIRTQLLNAPIITHVTLPNLYRFDFSGVNIYLEALLPHMTAPLLKHLRVQFYAELTFYVPHLLQFMTTADNFKFNLIKFSFHEAAISVVVGTNEDSFFVDVFCGTLDWQLSAVAQIFSVLGPLFSDVVELILDYRQHSISSERDHQANRTLWRELLGSFRNVKTLQVHNGLVRDLSRCLRLDGAPPLELLPELTKLICPVGSVKGKIFSSFIHKRKVVGKPVKLIGKTAGRRRYKFHSPNGTYGIDFD